MPDFIDLLPCKRCDGPAGEMIDEDGKQWARCRPCGIDYKKAGTWNSKNKQKENNDK